MRIVGPDLPFHEFLLDTIFDRGDHHQDGQDGEEHHGAARANWDGNGIHRNAPYDTTARETESVVQFCFRAADEKPGSAR
jgi:hypothetical protein